MVSGRYELAPVPDVAYVGFTDPAGGSGGDSFTLAIVHCESSALLSTACASVIRHFNPTMWLGNSPKL